METQAQLAAVARMQDFIAKNLAQPITLKMLAAAAGYSPWHSARLFAEHTGKAPFEYIRALRLSEAARRLWDENGKIIGTARLLIAPGKATIGRLCVSRDFRHRKIATRIMDEILSYCRELRLKTCELHAQLYLKAFYERCGFTALGEVYLEAGIEHITMHRSL